jgi:potassium-transporting ATPase potassium-binding subunit
MTSSGLIQAAIYIAVLLILAKPLGRYMARVFEGRIPAFARVLSPLERLVYRLCGVHTDEEMSWKAYAVGMLVFNAAGALAVYALQRLQGTLPLNPQHFGAVSQDSALNTAISFVTNTNWQGYAGESTMSYLTQMTALTVQNFVSAATGFAILLPLIRAFARHSTERLGNFWVDLTRGTVYVLLPLSVILSLALVSQGVVQTLAPYREVTPLDQSAARTQTLALGPAASQMAIKQLGTNGGGFFNANSAHPFENPTPLSNFLEMLAILLIPAALCHTLGFMVGDTRQGWMLLGVMTTVFLVFMFGCWSAEQSGNPRLSALGIDQTVREAPPSARGAAALAVQSGGNMEGKETRFGIVNSVIWATATTAASNGSVNSMHDSYTPLGGLVPMVLMKLGEIIFGGVGTGLAGMLVFVLVTVFISGLMVGRTPEYLGKKIEAFEMKMSALVVLIPPVLVLVCTAIAVAIEAGRSSTANPGPHGFSEILYAFASMGNNNGSAFAGLNANTPLYNLLGALAMFVSRYWLAIPTLAIAGALAAKKTVPAGAGTLPTHTALFAGLLVSVILLVGALTFLPALALGPIVEFLQWTH